MKTYDASLIKVIEETEHYARIYHPALSGMKTTEAIHFFEWLWSIGYRYLEGDTFAARYVICEKMGRKIYLVTDCSGYTLGAYSTKEKAIAGRERIRKKGSGCIDEQPEELFIDSDNGREP